MRLHADAAGHRPRRRGFDSATLSHCPPPPAREVVVYASAAGPITGAWSVKADASAAGGKLIANPDAGQAKITTPAPSPANSFEVTFNAVANVLYRLWIRGRAQANPYNNDSVYVQLSNSVTSASTTQWRIGTKSATKNH